MVFLNGAHNSYVCLCVYVGGINEFVRVEKSTICQSVVCGVAFVYVVIIHVTIKGLYLPRFSCGLGIILNLPKREQLEFS